MYVCVCATTQDEGTVVPMRLQSRANWTNERFVASHTAGDIVFAIDGVIMSRLTIYDKSHCNFTLIVTSTVEDFIETIFFKLS